MRKAKYILGFLLIGLLALFVFQNQYFFLEKSSFRIDLYFIEYHSPAFPNGSMIVAIFLIGFLLAYAISLSDRFKSKKKIKQLNDTIVTQRETISSFQSEKIGNMKEGHNPAESVVETN